MSEFSIQTEIEVLEVLVDESPCHVIEITNAVDRHPITIDQACSHLHSEGCIVPVGRGLYEITDAGEQRLEIQHDS
jgi:predicted transcriptional regulator